MLLSGVTPLKDIMFILIVLYSATRIALHALVLKNVSLLSL